MIIHIAFAAILMVLAVAGARRSIKTGELVRQRRANRDLPSDRQEEARKYWEAMQAAQDSDDFEQHWSAFNRALV